MARPIRQRRRSRSSGSASSQSPAEIKRAVGDSACFVLTDANISSWLGTQLLALYLSDPPLRALPSKPLAEFPFKAAQPDGIYTASRAGVMLLQSNETIEVVDTATGEVIRKSEMPESGRTEGLSPNGRIYAVSHEDRIDFKDATNGDFLISSQVCQIDDCGFQWVDARSFLTFSGPSSPKQDQRSAGWALCAVSIDQ